MLSTVQVAVVALLAFCLGALLGRFHASHCKHVWLEVSRTFVDPIKLAGDLFWIEGTALRAKHLTGFTTVLFLCKLCGRCLHEELPGHVHTPKVVQLKRVN